VRLLTLFSGVGASRKARVAHYRYWEGIASGRDLETPPDTLPPNARIPVTVPYHSFIKNVTNRALRPAVLAGLVLMACEKQHSISEPERLGQLPAGVCAYNGFNPASSDTRLVNTLGSRAEDELFSSEAAIQKQWYSGINSTYLWFEERSDAEANAYAAPSGHILFGTRMYRRTITQYGGLAVAGVLAHEGGHRVQQTLGWMSQYPVVVTELEADAFSGFYMAIVKRYAWNQIQGYFLNTYAAGSYYFNDPNFHGTPNQRVAAAYLGVNLAVYALSQPRPPSWLEMHEAFMSQMQVILVNPLKGAPTSVALNPAMKAVVAALPLAEIATGRRRAPKIHVPSFASARAAWTAPRMR
jgi:hypothetical protein